MQKEATNKTFQKAFEAFWSKTQIHLILTIVFYRQIIYKEVLISVHFFFVLFPHEKVLKVMKSICAKTELGNTHAFHHHPSSNNLGYFGGFDHSTF